MEKLIPLMVAIPLGGGFLCPLVGKFVRSRRVVELLALAVMAALLLLAVGQMVSVDRATYWMGGWTGHGVPIGISLVSDGLSQLLCLTINLVGLLAVLFSISYMRRFSSPGLYYSLFLLMVAGMNGVVMTGDLFNLYVFLEVAAISSYALVAFGTEKEELEASFKYLVLGGVSSVFVLFGIGILYNLTGHLNMARIAESLAAMDQAGVKGMQAAWLAGAFFLMGFGLKAAMVPFHAWLPDAHPSAPAPISAMLSGVLIKAIGVYVLARLMFNVLPVSSVAGHAVMALGVASMIVGGLLALGQWDLKRLLAYSSISQVGYVVMALGLALVLQATGGSKEVIALALFGGLFHLFNHALFKSLLFLCSGSIEYATGSRQLKDLSGLPKRMPVTGFCCRIAALSISGVPPLNGFWSKLAIVVALAMAGYWTLTVIAVAVAVVTLLMFARVQRYALEGEPSPQVEPVREAPATMCLSMILLAAMCLSAGLFVSRFRADIADPAVKALTEKAVAQKTMLVEEANK